MRKVMELIATIIASVFTVAGIVLIGAGLFAIPWMWARSLAVGVAAFSVAKTIVRAVDET
jgi:hypothetical protein